MDIKNQLEMHYADALKLINNNYFVGIFLQGSQNYGLETIHSDIDTKLIISPSFDSICFNKKPISTTHIRYNEEHIDEKDIRLYFQNFRKQNINFVEILFTKYYILNDKIKDYWNILIDNRELIAHYNMYTAVSCMKGMALEKYHALQHEYSSKKDVLSKYGYDPKQLHHILRLNDFMTRFINGESYENCLVPLSPEYLKQVKLGLYSLEDALKIATQTVTEISDTADIYRDKIDNICNPEVDEILDCVQREIIKEFLKIEFQKE